MRPQFAASWATDERKLEILDLLLAAPEAANRVLRSNAWLMPTRRATGHATARKGAIALATQRKIRLLSGGKRRRPRHPDWRVPGAALTLAWYRTSVRSSARRAT